MQDTLVESLFHPETSKIRDLKLLSGKKEEGKLGTSYSTIYPPEYYESRMHTNVETKQKIWFIRPHHVQVLTENPKSIKDNVLDSKYISKIKGITIEEQLATEKYKQLKEKDKQLNHYKQRLDELADLEKELY